MAENKKGELILKSFGRYLLLDHMVDGGMAKICRARFLGEQTNKIVAIKMIQPQYSSNESFRNMFMNEIKVAFALIHPNIAQTYDYGLEEGQLYTAMEYVDGKNLKEFSDKLRSRKFVFPAEISVHIIAQAAQGLHYAHTLTDKLTGQPYGIIHRDISPHNIMITYDGAVKVIDFGIAKANTNSEATQAGTIKGKISYLAPEYLEGKALDPRYDEFALGITLWEMLCGRKLFKASNDIAILKLIQNCKIPAPSSINPNVSKELDAIVLKALSADRNQRYPNCDQFNRALIRFLYSNYPDFNASDLSYFAKELFKEEFKADRERFLEFGKVDIKPFLEKMHQGGGKISGEETSTNSGSHSGLSDSDRNRSKEDGVILKSSNRGGHKNNVIDFGFEEEEKGKLGRLAKGRKAGGGAPGTSLNNGLRLSVGRAPTTVTNIASPRGTHTNIRRRSSTGTNVAAQSSGGMTKIIMFLIVAGLGYFGYQQWQKKKVAPRAVASQSVTTTTTSTTASSPKASNGKINLRNFEIGKQRVFINGHKVDVSALGVITYPMSDKPLTLRVEKDRRKHYVAKFNLNAANPVFNATIPEMPEQSYGVLIDHRRCDSGRITFELFGESREELVPLADPVALPAGSFTIYFQRYNSAVQKQVDLSIREDDVIELCDIIR